MLLVSSRKKFSFHSTGSKGFNNLTVLNLHIHLLSEAINCLNQAIDIYTDMVTFVSVLLCDYHKHHNNDNNIKT